MTRIYWIQKALRDIIRVSWPKQCGFSGMKIISTPYERGEKPRSGESSNPPQGTGSASHCGTGSTCTHGNGRLADSWRKYRRIIGESYPLPVISESGPVLRLR